MRSGDTPTEAHQDAAALWLAKKTGGSLSPRDAAALEDWLNADPRHRRAYDDARVLYAQLEAPARQLAAQSRKQWWGFPSLRPRWSWALAPVLPAFALLLLWLVNPAWLVNQQADIVTSRQVVSTVTLPDGSLARLGADTALKLDFQHGRRRVSLLRGEAYFEVQHGGAGVFTVAANGDEIRDIGTKFNIDIVGRRTDVVVTEGAVEVQGGTDATATKVSQGHQVAVRDGYSGRVEVADTDIALSWMSGRLVVQGATIEEVATALQRHGSGRILVRSGLAERRVSGTFPLTDVGESLATIAEAVDGSILHATSFLTILY
ncbi:FecR domain-containing protein [Azorhizobium sp. AG788]|uniref:FecR family protein n=1 Tax=Azorhizobium sp. AG788 TaxID=2183897 RepID=UPI003139F3FC